MSAQHLSPLGGGAPSGRYDLGAVLASGGMGTVHRAFDRLGQRWVAYKRMRSFEPAQRARMAAYFQREYDTLTRLAHPNIVEAYDYGFDAQGPYYTMELLTGADFAQLAPLPVSQACQLLRDVASALGLLQARRLVHRDLSPRNVRLTQAGRAKLIDFGVLTPFGPAAYAVGAAPFIAPESLAGETLDQRADLYGLGALAYFLITGHTHVRARSMEELPEAWRERLRPPSQLADAVPQALDDLVLSLLELSVAARPSSAAQVIEQLSAIAQLPAEAEAARVAHGYLVHAPLLGRQQVLDKLSGALSEATRGRGQIVVLEGEQGLGRSALLDRLAIDGQVVGAHVLRTRAGGRAPFAVARDLVRDGLALAGGADDALGSLERDATLSRSSIDAWERQAAAADSLAQLFLALSAAAPFVLLVDDVQDMDGESLSWLASLADQLLERPVLLVLALCKGEACEDAQAWAKLATRAGHHELAPLDAAEVEELVSSLFGAAANGPTLAAWLYGQTGGNPGHCMDLARLLLAQGAIRYAQGAFTIAYEFGQATPDRHRGALLARLEQVSEEARALAQLLALHDGPLSVLQLVRARGGQLPRVVRALEELVQRGAVLTTRVDQYACASELLRAAIQSTLSAPQSRALHRALGRAFAQPGDTSPEGVCAVAEHLLEAGEDERLEAALMLARWAEPYKFDLALQRRCVSMLETALSILTDHGYSDRDCIPVLVPICLAGYYGDSSVLDRYSDRTMSALGEVCGLTTAVRARRHLRPRAALMLGLASAYCLRRVEPTKLRRLSFVKYLECLIVVAGTSTAAAAYRFDVRRAERIAAFIEPLAAAHPRSPLHLSHLLCTATVDLVSGRLKNAATKYRQLLLAYERPVLGIDARHAQQLRRGILVGLAEALLSEHPSEALQVIERLDLQGPGAFYAPHAESVRASYFAYRGDAQRAAYHRRRAETLSLRTSAPWSVVSVMAMRLTLPSALSGDIVALTSVVSDLAQLSTLSPGLTLLHELACAHLSFLRGKLDEALASYERIFANPEARLLATYTAERSFQVLALSARGEHEQARALGQALVSELECDREGRANEHLHCIVGVALARVELALGEVEAAARRLDACLARDLPKDSVGLHGSLQRERAYAAALAGDGAAFDLHYANMVRHFRSTNNPLFAQQCVALEAEARRLELRFSGVRSLGFGADGLDFETVIERPLRTTSRP